MTFIQRMQSSDLNHGKGVVVTAATDGACSGNPGPGGWGALIRFEDGTVEEFGGHEAHTTNNRMELTAALMTLRKLKELDLKKKLTIKTDSKYLIDGYSKWINGWKQKGWKTASGKEVLNQDLWCQLDSLRLADVELEYVKGHSGNADNERVDKIAVNFSKGTDITLESRSSSHNKQTTSTTEFFKSESSETLCRLISKLDMASHVASQGYGLTTTELAELTSKPIHEIKQKFNSWQWRDWIIEPIDENLWRLNSITKSKKD